MKVVLILAAMSGFYFAADNVVPPVVDIYQYGDKVVVYRCDDGREDPVVTKHIQYSDDKHIYLYNGNCQET